MRWTEIFYSIQGEGLRVGKPSIFIRMFGCNLKCQGFGMPFGELSNEYLEINPKDYKETNQLPLVRNGCDSYAAWDVRAKHLVTSGTANDIIAHIKNELSHYFEVETMNNMDWLRGIDIVITGGEPMLGRQSEYSELLDFLYQLKCETITFETNGTKELQTDFKDWLDDNKHIRNMLIWSISPKLRNSGESPINTLHQSKVESLTTIPNYGAYLKFVVREGMDADIHQAIKMLVQPPNNKLPVYVMPEGGTKEDYERNSKAVAEMALRHKWIYSPRLQVDLFNNEWGT